MSHLPTARGARVLARASALALAASAGVAATLPAAASAQAAVELRLAMPRPDPRLEELALRVRCVSACTIRLDSIGVVLYPSGGVGAGDQLPGAAEAPLRGTRRLPAGKATTIRFAVPAEVRTFTISALAQRTVALAMASVDVTPAAGETFPAVAQAAIHLRSTPNRPTASLPAIAVPDGVRPSGGVRRYRVTVKADQRTEWAYQADRTTGACTVISNGSGWQTLRLRTTRPIVARLWHERGDMVLSGGIARRNWYWVYAGVPVRVDAERDGVRNAGVEGTCSGVPGGDDGTGGPSQRACVRRGTRTLPVHLTANGPTLSAWLTLDIYDRGPGVPDCPFERLHQARDDYAFLSAFVIRNSDPTRAKRAGDAEPGQFVIVEDKARTDPIPGGSVRTRTRWTITFRRIG